MCFARIRSRVEATLVLVGDGPERELAENLADELGVHDQVLFLGKLESVAELLACADLFLLPSEQESFGLVALEAQASGVPVVGTQGTGLEEGDRGWCHRLSPSGWRCRRHGGRLSGLPARRREVGDSIPRRPRAFRSTVLDGANRPDVRELLRVRSRGIVNLFEAVLLGVIQGFSEFLPVSSSGHLVLAQALLEIRLPGVAFEVTVHVATLCAVMWVYRRRISELLRGLVQRDQSAVRYVGLLILATLPGRRRRACRQGLPGGGLRKADRGGRPAPCQRAFWPGRSSTADRRAAAERPTWLQTVAVGVAQAVAILPGVSRSGATVATGAWLGVDVLRMAEFSFLMSVPAIAGAAGVAGRFDRGSDSRTGGLAAGRRVRGRVSVGCRGNPYLCRGCFARAPSIALRTTAGRVGLGYLVAAVFVPTLRV